MPATVPCPFRAALKGSRSAFLVAHRNRTFLERQRPSTPRSRATNGPFLRRPAISRAPHSPRRQQIWWAIQQIVPPDSPRYDTRRIDPPRWHAPTDRHAHAATELRAPTPSPRYDTRPIDPTATACTNEPARPRSNRASRAHPFASVRHATCRPHRDGMHPTDPHAHAATNLRASTPSPRYGMRLLTPPRADMRPANPRSRAAAEARARHAPVSRVTLRRRRRATFTSSCLTRIDERVERARARCPERPHELIAVRCRAFEHAGNSRAPGVATRARSSSDANPFAHQVAWRTSSRDVD
jgi:hypothetical protein